MKTRKRARELASRFIHKKKKQKKNKKTKIPFLFLFFTTQHTRDRYLHNRARRVTKHWRYAQVVFIRRGRKCKRPRQNTTDSAMPTNERIKKRRTEYKRRRRRQKITSLTTRDRVYSTIGIPRAVWLEGYVASGVFWAAFLSARWEEQQPYIYYMLKEKKKPTGRVRGGGTHKKKGGQQPNTHTHAAGSFGNLVARV